MHHSCIHSCILFVHFIHAFIHACIHSCFHSCIHTFIHSCIRAFNHAFIHSFIHSCISLFLSLLINQLIYLFINLLGVQTKAIPHFHISDNTLCPPPPPPKKKLQKDCFQFLLGQTIMQNCETQTKCIMGDVEVVNGTLKFVVLGIVWSGLEIFKEILLMSHQVCFWCVLYISKSWTLILSWIAKLGSWCLAFTNPKIMKPWCGVCFSQALKISLWRYFLPKRFARRFCVCADRMSIFVSYRGRTIQWWKNLSNQADQGTVTTSA